MKKWAIYKHICPEGKIYIGKTSRPPIRRWTSGNKYRNNIDLCEAIQRNGGEDEFLTAFEHYILSSDAETWIEWHRDLSFDETNVFTEEEAELFEKLWVYIYDSMDPRKGYNRTTGGERGFSYSEVAKLRFVKAREGMHCGSENPFWGKSHSVETREKISQLARMRTGERSSFYGKHHTSEAKEKNRQAHLGMYDGECNPFYGCHHTEKAKSQMSEQHKKIISSYDLTGKRLETYPSVSSAAETMGVSIATISACATKKTKMSCGMVWRYSTEDQLPENELPANHVFCKPISQYSLDGELIKTFASLKEAANDTGISGTSISKVALGKATQAGGFKWKYNEVTH